MPSAHTGCSQAHDGGCPRTHSVHAVCVQAPRRRNNRSRPQARGGGEWGAPRRKGLRTHSQKAESEAKNSHGAPHPVVRFPTIRTP